VAQVSHRPNFKLAFLLSAELLWRRD